MSSLIFEDRVGKLCSIFEINYLQTVYPHWDLKQSPETLYDLVAHELQNVLKNSKTFSELEFSEKQTKNFLIHQTQNNIRNLKRLKRFLEEGIDKGYKLVLE